MALFKIVAAVVILHSAVIVPSLARQNANLRGLFAPVFSPMDYSGRPKLDVIPHYAEYLQNSNIQGVLVAGTAGEGPEMSVPQVKALISAWVVAGRAHNLKIIAQVSGRSIPDCQELARYAEEEGVDAIMALPELYLKPSTVDELVYNMGEIAKAAPHTPLMYYDIRQITDVNLDMAEFVVKAMQRIPNFIGLKEESLEQALRVQPIIEENHLTIFIANSINLGPAVLMGFENYIMTEISILPHMFNEILSSGQTCHRDRTVSMYQRLMHISNTIRNVQNPNNAVPAMKTAMTIVSGIDMGPPRSPQIPLSKEQAYQLERQLRQQLH